MVHIKGTSTNFTKYDSIHELVEYMKGRPNGKNMQGMTESSTQSWSQTNFTGTDSYEEAEKLMMYGDKVAAERLQSKLQVEKNSTSNSKRLKQEYSVAGYQASVPRYLQGIPTSMINSRQVPMKQKIVRLVKSTGYTQDFTKEQIFENSVKALQIVIELEAKGYRVELDTIRYTKSTEHSQRHEVVLVNIKKSSERLSVAKIAFMLTNPSFHRRIGFKWLEVADHVGRGFKNYGRSSQSTHEIMSALKDTKQDKGVYVIPGVISDPMQVIADWKL